jgi:hypothetical protein
VARCVVKTAPLARRASPPVTHDKHRGSLARHIGNAHSASLKRGTHGKAGFSYVSTQPHLHANATQRREPSRETLAAFAYGATLLAANSFDFCRAFRRGSRVAFRRWSRVTDRLGLLAADRLGLRIADRLGQHLMQLSLGRCGRFCHFATISLSTSRLP